MRKLTFLFALLCASMMSWAVQYCDFPTGHENNADFGDANGRILLTLVPTGNSNEYQLTIKPNYANGATKQLDYLYVIAGGNSPYPAEAGADGSTGYDELSVTFTNSNATTSFTIQWSNPDWGGRWQCTLNDINLSALEACSGGGATPDPDPDPTPDPEPVSYCDFPTGHEGNPNFGDANGRILLSLEPTGNANEYKMTIKPNYDNGATKKLDYLYVIAAGNSPYPAEAGIDESGIGYDELSVTFTNSNTTTSFMIQWSNPDWGGRWQCNLNDIKLSDLAPCSTPSIASEYCGQAMSSGNTLAKFTWETTDEGNVNITIIEALGGAPSATFFRGNGITADKIKIGEGREPITTYFTHPGNINTQQTLTLTLTDPANAPAPGTKIYVENQIIEYATSMDGNAWPTLSFEYTYGGVCADESILTEIALNASATFAKVGESVTLTAQPLDQMGVPMAGSVNFEISPADAGSIVGDVFTFAKTGVVTITASIDEIEKSITLYGVPSDNLALNQPSEGGYYDNNPAEGFDKANDGNTNTAWVTYADRPASEEWWYVDLGDTYSLTAVDVVWGDPSSTSYKVFARMDAPSEEDKADDSAWEEIASVSGIGINSEQFNVVSVNARYVRVRSLTKTANFLRMKEVRVFGSEYVPVEDTEKPEMTSASLESSTYTEAVINVAATDNVGIYRYHVVDGTNGIDANFAESAGQITITGLTHATSYNFTITAKDAAGNESENSIVVPVSTPFDGSINLALNQPCEGGYYDNNPAESDDKANDGLENTQWTTYGAHAIELDWWVVDLGQIYNLTNISVLWGDQYSTNYILQARVEAPSAADKADDAAWVTLATVADAAANAEKSTNVSGVGRYVRFRALAHTGFLRLREFRVFGSGVAAEDAEAPVMNSASLVSSADTYAVIAVAATDNVGVAKFHVVDAGNSFDAEFAAEAGNITVTGLNGGTNYTLVITAIDFFGNESANNKSVAVNTIAHYTEPQVAAPVPAWPADQVKSLYSNYAFAPASLNSYNEPWWNWPNMSEGNVDGNTYLYYNLAADGMIGWQFAQTSITTMEKLHIDIWASAGGTLSIRPITTGGPTVRKTLTLVGQQWNSFDIELTEFPGHDWSKLFQMAFEYWNAGGLTGEYIAVDNVFFYRTTPPPTDEAAPTDVVASKVEESFTSAKISAQANDDSGVVHFKVLNGTDVLVSDVEAVSDAAVTITVNGLTPNTNYTLSVVAFDEAGHEAEPVNVTVATKATPSAAPQPTHDAADVLSVYSDAYDPAVAATFNKTNWGSAPVALEADYLLYAMTSNVIIFGNNDGNPGHGNIDGLSGYTYEDKPGLDVSGMTRIHFDVWCDVSDQLNTVNINDVAVAIPSTRTVAGEWVSFDVDITGVALAERQNVRWLKFHPFSTTNCNAAIDNVYFYKAADLVRDDSWMAPGELGTICIPNGAIAKGGDIYELVGKNSEGKIVFATVPNNEMTPGKPYLFEAKSNAMNFYFTDATPASEPVNSGAMKGTFNEVTLTGDQLTNVYYFAGHALWSCVDLTETGLHVSANRAYVKLDEVSDVSSMSPAPGRRYITMGVNGKNTATGIGNVQGDEVQSTKVLIDGQFFILRGEKLYDATGRLVK